MSPQIIQSMLTWFDHHRPSLLSDGMAVEFSCSSGGDPSSARLDFESMEVFARATVWDDGRCDLEMLATDSGKQLMWKHVEGVDAESIAQTLTEFVEAIAQTRKDES